MAKRNVDVLLKELEALKKENSELKYLIKSEKKRTIKDENPTSNDILLQLNDYSFKLAFLPADELFPFITSKVKSIFNVRGALINTYDEATSELVLQYTTLSDKENANLIKVLGGTLLKRRTYVNKKNYKRITTNIYEQITSLHELTFGAIPDVIGRTIEKVFGIDWFAALGLVHNKKLVGTMILVGDKSQQYPEKETILAFAGITANALVRKDAEEKLSETNKRFQSIVYSSPYGMQMYELQEEDKLVLIGANPAADKILGLEHNSKIGLTIEEAFPSLIETEIPTKYKEVLKKKRVWKKEQIIYEDATRKSAFEVFAFTVSENQMVASFLEITDRLQKEQTLKQSQENLDITLKSIGDGVISTDKLGRVTNMNPVAEEMSGWKLEDAKGKQLEDVFVIVDASTRHNLNNPVEKVITTGKVVELSNHTLLISKDGTERNIADSAAPIIDNHNNIQGVVLVFSDVTEKYKAREESKAREHRAVKHRKALTELATSKVIASGDISSAKKLLTEIAAEALEVEQCSLWLMSPDNTEMKCIDLFNANNKVHSEGIIIKVEEYPTYFKEVTENSPLAVRDVINDVRTNELAEAYLLPLGIVSMLDSKVASEDGGFGGVVCFEHTGKQREWYTEEEAFATTIASYLVQILSVTRKKEADSALKDEKERISTILNLVGDPIFVKDNQHRFVLCNRAFYEMVGLEENGVIGKTLAEGIPDGEMEHFLKIDRMVLDTGIPDSREESLTINNKKRTIVTNKTRFIDKAGNKLLIGSIHDISDRDYAEKEKAHFNDLMKYVISNTKSSVAVFDTEMNYIYVSDRYYDDFHLEDNNIVGRNHYDVFPDLPQYLRDIHKSSLNGETIRGEGDPLVHADGSIDWANWSCLPWYKADGTIGGIITYMEVITERKKKEEQITLLAQMVNIAPGGIIVHDFDGQILYANQRAAQMHGCNNEEFQTFSLRDVDTPENAELIPERMENLKKNGEINFEGRHRRKDGTTYPVEVYAKIIEWGDNPAILSLTTDITERKHAQNKLFESELQFRDLFNSAADAIFIADAESGLIMNANKTAEKMLNSTLENIIGKHQRDLHPAEIKKMGEETFQQHKKEIEEMDLSNPIESIVLNSNGAHIPVEVIASKVIYQGKKCIMGIFRDITERKKAEDKLRITKDTYESIFNSVSEAIYVLDEKGSFIDVNRGAELMYGYSREELIGKNPAEVSALGMNDLHAVQKAIQEVAITGISTSFEFWGVRKNGGVFPKDVSINRGKYFGKYHIVATARDITERKKAEEELERTRIQLIETIMQSPLPMVLASAENFKIKVINKATEDFLLIDANNYLEKSLMEIDVVWQEYTPEGKKVEANELPLPRALQGKFTNDKEMRLERSDGSSVWQLASGAPIFNSQGNLIAGLLVMQDITQIKLTEEALKKSEAEFRNLFESANDAILIFEPETEIILEVNNKACEIYGFTKEELIGMSLKVLTKDVAAGVQQIEKAINTGKYGNFETQQVNKNGDTIYFLINASLIDYMGKKAILSINRNISERKRAEKVQEILYNVALHIHLEKSTKDLLEFVRQEIGNVMDTSNFFVALYNPERDTLKEVIYVDEMDNFESDEWSAGNSISGHVVKQGKTVFLKGDEIAEFYKHKNLGMEGTIPKSWIGVPIFSHSKAIGIMVTQNYKNLNVFSDSDVTMLEMIAHEIGVFIEKHTMIEELVKAKEKAEEMNRAKSHFFANMSHELRTPFVGIMGYAELLAESLENEDERLMAEGILKASSRMQGTLSNILGLAKLETDSIEIKKNQVEMNKLITGLFESFKGGTLLKKLSFEKEINFDELLIETDELMLKDILQNLISNAIKYTEEGSVKLTAKIGTNEDSGNLEIKVTDTGIGIPEDMLKIIWEPFRQVSEGLNRSFEGTGLGLSIVKKSVELLGGNIEVESIYGKGSIFKLSLPINKGL
ncbi:MAG: PAS domain S-box protein [Ignavibacteriaceae bacterium]|nr:PAS domain S-box protein [Ignavibacteriaceae bacterium]